MAIGPAPAPALKVVTLPPGVIYVKRSQAVPNFMNVETTALVESVSKANCPDGSTATPPAVVELPKLKLVPGAPVTDESSYDITFGLAAAEPTSTSLCHGQRLKENGES